MPSAPVAATVPVELIVHNDKRVDPYFWLREKTNLNVLAHLQAENRYTEEVLAPTAELQKTIYGELLSRLQETDTSVPVPDGPWLYYTRTRTGLSYPIYCRRAITPPGAAEAPEEILLDANRLAEGHAYFRLGVFQPSPDHTLLAYSTDTTGEESFTLHFIDLATGQPLTDRIRRTYYEFAWAADNRTVFYNTLDEAHRPYRVWRHTLGDTAPDTLVFEETDERFLCGVEATRDHRYILVSTNSSITSEVHFLPAAEPTAALRLITPRRDHVEYEVGHQNGRFLIRTNLEARNFRLVTALAESPDRWTELVPHRPDVMLEGFAEFAEHLVLFERSNGLRRIIVDQAHSIEVPEPVYHLSPHSNPTFATSEFRFTYTSLVSPPSVFAYDMKTRERRLLKQEPVPGYDPERYTTERQWATASDGTRIPMALVYRRGLVRDGRNPTLLYGYGSYGINMEASFKSDRFSLLDRGFVFAIANIRGGSEMGRHWYEDGKFLQKKNTFTDFIACAEHLIAQRYTSPAHLAIEGRSAGGLLMGAAVNLRPDLFRAVLAGVPFVDCLSTMLDETLPLTIGEYEEWGNPNDPDYYAYMKSYSPYDNVRPAAYPDMLVTAGLNDPRVSYWEPAKWVAKLRAAATNEPTILLKTNMGAGHFGQSGRYDALKETALYYAFFLQALGILDGKCSNSESE